MIAAIYARKSTDQQDKAHEAKSVTRQVERAREYAGREGWAVAEEHIYVDDAVSGADHDKLVGRARLLNALKPRTPFQMLVMMEESRLGRDQEKTPAALFQILGRLLPRRVVFTPNLEAGTWMMRAECSLGRIVGGLLG